MKPIDYVKILQDVGKDKLTSVGFISSRPVEDGTFFYNVPAAYWFARLSGNKILFYHYTLESKKFSLVESETIKLPKRFKNAKLVHLDTRVLEKNCFGVSFAIAEPNGKNTKIWVVSLTQRISMLRDLTLQFNKLSQRNVKEIDAIADELNSSKKVSSVDLAVCEIPLLYSENLLFYGGNGMLLIYDKKNHTLHKINKKGEKTFTIQHFKNIPITTVSPIFEIVSRDRFIVLGGASVLLADGSKFEKIDVHNYPLLDANNLSYLLVKLKEGDAADLVFFSETNNKGLLVLTDPSEADYGKAFEIDFKR